MIRNKKLVKVQKWDNRMDLAPIINPKVYKNGTKERNQDESEISGPPHQQQGPQVQIW